MGKMNKNIHDLTVNSKPLLRGLEVCREFMTGYSWEMYSLLRGGTEVNFIFEWT